MRLPVVLALLLAGSGSAVAKECRMPDVPPGVQVQLPPECRQADRRDAARAAERGAVRGDRGFVDVGGGTQVRIGGRVRGEMGISR
ncbi:MAG TPA: hypothetical protein VEZ16_06840 [Microvirga sp.]|nr:hypothetical protein [Microvirga sp.]